MKCPICKEPMEMKTTYQRTGAVIGGGAGAFSGAFGGMKLGAKLGGVPGGIIGAVTGFVAGGTLGSKAGRLIDENYVAKYYCPNCGKTLKA